VQAFDRHDASLLLACFIFLYANLFADPETPFLLGGDQVFHWTEAQRLLHGEQVYRDFFEFTPPGADLIYLSVFKLFGPRVWTTNLVVLALGVLLCVLCLGISKSIMPRAQAVLATSLYVVFVFGMTLNATHHFFSLAAVLGAVTVLLKGATPTRLAVAGFLLGLATFITQTTGPVAALGVAAWMTWERFRTQQSWWSYLRRQILLFAPLLVTWLLLSSYYIATLGLRQLWYFQVTYVRAYAVSGWNALSIGFPHGLSPRALLPPLTQWLFAYVVLPIVYTICLWRCWGSSREAPSSVTTRVSLLTLVGAAMFVEVAQSPSWFRFYCISLPGVVLLVWLAGGWFGKFSIYATRMLWIGVIGLAGYRTWSTHVSYSTIELPAGRIATTALGAEKLSWFAARTKPGQFILQARWPGIYLPLALRNPLFLDVLEGRDVSRPGCVALSVRQLEAKRVQYIMWSPGAESVDLPPRSLTGLQQYLTDHYRLIWRFSDQDEVWKRNAEDAASENVKYVTPTPADAPASRCFPTILG
jgi:hypothetical protein